MKRTKLVTSVVLLVALAGCGSNADTVGDNISKEAEKFKVGRRIVVTNSITDKVEFSVRGPLLVGGPPPPSGRDLQGRLRSSTRRRASAWATTRHGPASSSARST
jgi:predicted small secreted protein